jgi:uncharacterized protein (DUF58 family)
MSGLLPLRPAFLARLDAARGLGWRLFRGAHALGAPGAPPEEFEGHRPYFPGDDVRWIDWSLFARREEFYVKVFRADEEVEVVLLLDASPSMTGGRGLKYRTAAAAGAALARLALLTDHPVRVARYAGRLLDVAGPWRSPDDIAAVQRHLAETPPRGEGTNLAPALDPLVTGRQRPVSLVMLTDGFQEAPLVSAILQALARGARRAALVRVIDADDLSPALRGHTVLRDPEGPGRRDLFADRALEEAAHRRIAHHFQLLGEALAGIGSPLHELPVGRPFEEAFLDMLRATAPAPRA